MEAVGQVLVALSAVVDAASVAVVVESGVESVESGTARKTEYQEKVKTPLITAGVNPRQRVSCPY